MEAKVFYTDDGKIYKATEPKADSHAQMNFPNDDILAVLDETPISREAMVGRINELGVKRHNAVLANTDSSDV